MRFHPFEVSIPHIVYAALGGFIVLFGMFSLFIREKLYIGEAIWAFLFGVVIGPYGANIFDPRGWGGGDREVTNTITLEVTRVVLAIGVFAIGVELPKAYMQKHWKSLLFLLGPVMTWGWFVSGGLIYALIPGLNFLSSLVVAACLTPTDPILAAAVVGGKYADKHVPAHLRHLLAAESGCNDGAAFPFLFIALYLITDSSTSQAISDWFLLLWLYQVVVGIVFGAVLGFGFRHLMKFCERKDLIDRQSYVAQYVSLAMLTIGATTLLGSDDLLAAFSCGAAFAWDGFFNKQTEESVFSSVIDLLFNIAAFVFVGAWMPFSDFANEQLTLSVWRLLVIAILVMLLRRLPIIIALYRWIPDIKTFREAIFSGHFGPMGIGAVFICTLAAEQLPRPEEEPENQQQLLAASIQPIVAFMVLVSIAIHGLSIPFFTFGRRVHSMSRTWSRHDTVGTFGSRRRSILPEWTTQIRHVQPGEEIVINRDGDGHEDSLTPVDGGSSQDEKHEDDIREKGERRGGNPPDGTEVIQEWKEGPHKVIERREGPGAEVQVEVQRNAYGPSETTTHTLHVAADMSRRVVDDIRHKMQHAPDELEHTLAQVEQGVKHEAHEVERKTKEAGLTALAATISPQSARAKRDGQEQGQDEEDEGWMSDRSAGEPSGSGSSAAVGSSRGKSPKLKIPKPKISVTRPSGSRKRSIRRNVLGQRPQTIHRSQSEDITMRRPPVSLDEDDESGAHYAAYGDPDEPASGAATPSEETRGRTSAMRSPRAPPGDGTHSGTHTPIYIRPTHKRIGSIRSGAPSREMSPARSVRFADDGKVSGAASPRLLSPTSQTFSQPASPSAPPSVGGTSPLQQSSENESQSQTETDGQQEDDSPRSQAVRFSLPAPGDTANHVHGEA
ncbi:Sodium/hydrogen exchanger family-domain-containing protein [Daedaleopsis nitida]|nr:Sodium/hydrogen exchanger family-domain-containing protein [Daedaleopsis nitida]